MVDSNPTLLKHISKHFEIKGCEALTASDGLEALAILDSKAPDMLITDIPVNKIGGDLLCKIVREQAGIKDIFIAISSSIPLHGNRRLTNLDADIYINRETEGDLKKHVQLIVEQYEKNSRKRKKTNTSDSHHAPTSRQIELYSNHYHTLFNNVDESVVELDKTGHILRVNKAAQTLFARESAALLSTRLPNLIEGAEKDEMETWIARVDKEQSKNFNSSYLNPLKVNSNKVLLKMASSREGSKLNILCIFKDITQQQKTEKELAEALAKVSHLANHDPLTGLPNLRLATERLLSAISLSKRKGWKAAIMFIDLDGFKKVNDSYGHDIGDKLLKQVADRLVGSLRETDTVARIGGDEFLVIQTEVTHRITTSNVAEKIVRKISEPFILEDKEIMVGASIGISIYPEHGTDRRILLKKADDAMYYTKRIGKNNFSFTPG